MRSRSMRDNFLESPVFTTMTDSKIIMPTAFSTVTPGYLQDRVLNLQFCQAKVFGRRLSSQFSTLQCFFATVVIFSFTGIGLSTLIKQHLLPSSSLFIMCSTTVMPFVSAVRRCRVVLTFLGRMVS